MRYRSNHFSAPFLLLFTFCLNASASEALWTWVKGSSTANSPGVYGTLGMAASANTPGARAGCATWTGKDGRLWLFGGITNNPPDTFHNDLWCFDPATGKWTWVKGSKLKNQAAVYGTQGVATDANTPGARYVNANWTDKAGRLWLYGGGMITGPGTANPIVHSYSDLWRFDPATGKWTWVKGSNQENQPPVYGTQGNAADANTPGTRMGSATWTDKIGRFWLFGVNSSKNDLWCYDPATNNWTWVKGSKAISDQPGVYGVQGVAAPANNPGGRGGAMTWTDAGGGLWLFGGIGLGANIISGRLNDLWRFNPATGNWTWVKGSNQIDQFGVYGTKGVAAPANTPGAREMSCTWIDTFGQFWLFGGEGWGSSDDRLNDLWRYDMSANNWVWEGGSDTANAGGAYGTQGVAAPTNIPSAREGTASWADPNRGRLWLFGGANRRSPSDNMYDDLWTLTVPRNAVESKMWRLME